MKLKSNKEIQEKLLEIIDEMEDKQYSSETILESIKNNLKFNKFEKER